MTTTTKPKVYCAGKMRGIPDFGAKAFAAAAKHFRELAYEVRSPAEKDEEDGFDGNLDNFDMHKAMQWDLEAVLWADYIALLPGWETSQGVAMETAVARATGKTPLIVEIYDTNPLMSNFEECVFSAFEEYTWERISKDYPDRVTLDLDKLLGITQVDHENMVNNITQIRVDPPTPISPLYEAYDAVHGDRGAAYGHPKDDFERQALIFQAILGTPVTPEQVALMLIGVKMSRLVNTPGHHDSIVDIGGYAETYYMITQRREEEKKMAALNEWLGKVKENELDGGPFYVAGQDE